MNESFDFDLRALIICIFNAGPGSLATIAQCFCYGKSDRLFAQTAAANNHILYSNFNYLSRLNIVIVGPLLFSHSFLPPTPYQRHSHNEQHAAGSITRSNGPARNLKMQTR